MALTDHEIDLIHGWLKSQISDAERLDGTSRAYISRLIADLRALRAAVRALYTPELEVSFRAVCPFCEKKWNSAAVRFDHSPDCPWAVARALAGEEG